MPSWSLHAVCLLAASLTTESVALAQAPPAPASTRTAWQEHFNRVPLDWFDPFDHGAAQLARVYAVKSEDGSTFLHLHARHDVASGSAPPAMHYGHAFGRRAIPLERVSRLTWKWRVNKHPRVGNDAWEDMAAGVYVITKTPSVLFGGRGFKFGWLAHPGERGTHQHGLLQVELRHEAATSEWRTESVDLCALYKAEFGSCSGENVLYVGVVTDADGTKSVADADYAEFQLDMR